MSLLTELEAATFGGVTFLIESANTSGGRKVAIHEFVNSDVRNVEDLGRQLRTYKVVGIITGENYLTDRNRLIAALERGGRQVLQHPFYGRVDVVAKPYTLLENLTDLGVARFSMVFEAADAIVRPVPQPGNTGALTALSAVVNDKLAKDVEIGLITPAGQTSTFDRAVALGKKVAAQFESINEFTAPKIRQASEYAASLEKFGDSVVKLVSAPAEFATSVKDLFDQVNLIVLTDLTQGLNAIDKFFNFNIDSLNLFRNLDVGNDISSAEATSAVNDQVITRQVRMTSLSLAYQTISRIEFSNLDELDTAQQLVEDQYQAVVDDPNAPSETLELLKELRDEAEVFFQNQRLTINRVIELRVKRAPAQVITYFLYGDLDLYQDIVDLNADPNVSFYEGTIEALTQ